MLRGREDGWFWLVIGCCTIALVTDVRLEQADPGPETEVLGTQVEEPERGPAATSTTGSMEPDGSVTTTTNDASTTTTASTEETPDVAPGTTSTADGPASTSTTRPTSTTTTTTAPP